MLRIQSTTIRFSRSGICQGRSLGRLSLSLPKSCIKIAANNVKQGSCRRQFTGTSTTTAAQHHHYPKTVLTEHVYGRTRIYTSTMGKTKTATASKTCIAAPVTSPSLTWEWLHPQHHQHSTSNQTTVNPDGTSSSQHARHRPSFGSSLINGAKQNFRELFLPVGYPDALHSCYKKFHLWLGLETYVGSAVN
ncbi:hypothetical protein BCR42DRAFT_58036 [Absidia repens]|uniref:Uncharacterized protein n=1 Tax=Absidia repens TaxID=90262 RepID=A0A1X2IE82_9FUNG|nr:hypothetical protein BCR42DRAFT_58036 [Absidia repens]